jgi:hypothetical protein
VRGLGAGDRIGREELELLLRERVVVAQAQRAGDDLGAEGGGRVQAGLRTS